jgi:hypothetical protein
VLPKNGDEQFLGRRAGCSRQNKGGGQYVESFVMQIFESLLPFHLHPQNRFWSFELKSAARSVTLAAWWRDG